MKTLLSVDFDYFVPEKQEYDFGHSETLMFLSMIWSTRMFYYDHIKTTGGEEQFWNLLNSKVSVVKSGTFVSESHAYAHSLLHGIGHIILVDAHHDCWYGDSLGIDKTVKDIYCHNWVREWLKGNKKRRVTWVQPEWSVGNFSVPTDLLDRVTVISEGDDWGVKQIDRVHICRSGCWVPPWLDQKFINFVNNRGGSIVKMQDGDWDPMVKRWTDEYLQEGLNQNKEVLKKIGKMMDQRGTLKIGTISSENFVNSRVEQKLAS
jgi:hypothetical protein